MLEAASERERAHAEELEKMEAYTRELEEEHEKELTKMMAAWSREKEAYEVEALEEIIGGHQKELGLMKDEMAEKEASNAALRGELGDHSESILSLSLDSAPDMPNSAPNPNPNPSLDSAPDMPNSAPAFMKNR